MNRIVCLGNRYVHGDGAGLSVYDHLLDLTLPPNVQLVDGGLAGLDLLGLVEASARVVFVDAVRGFAPAGTVVVLSREAVAAQALPAHTHGAGLPYLLRVLPKVCDGPLPEITVVGVEEPSDRDAVQRAALVSLCLALGGQTSCERIPRCLQVRRTG